MAAGILGRKEGYISHTSLWRLRTEIDTRIYGRKKNGERRKKMENETEIWLIRQTAEKYRSEMIYSVEQRYMNLENFDCLICCVQICRVRYKRRAMHEMDHSKKERNIEMFYC